jgi:hypothetical protein
MSQRHILYELPVIQGNAFRAVAIDSDPMVEANMVNGYVHQGVKARMSRAGS